MFLSGFCLTALFILLGATNSAAMSPRTDERPVGSVAAAWYASWHATEGFPLSAVNWTKYNTLIYSFVTTTSSPDNLSLDGTDTSLLADFVCKAHQHNVSAHAGIGGWGGSIFFSSNVGTSENRTAFVQTVVGFAEEFHLDGISFDWEYPNKQGIGCNTINANDTENFLSFLQQLRADPVGASLTLSAATSITPFTDASGHPSTDVSGFVKVLDYIVLMNYDVWGSWSSTVGPNAPLNDTCASAADQQGSAVSAVKAWTEAGMSSDKIVLGVPSYGHSFRVSPSDAFVQGSATELTPHPPFSASNPPPGGKWDNTGSVDACGVHEAPGGSYEFRDLVEEGFLAEDGNAAPGIYYRWDDCSQTSFVYNDTSGIMISYDDAASFAAKGKFILDVGLRGFALWEAGGDYDDTLVDSIRLWM